MPFVKTPELEMYYAAEGRGKHVLLFVHGNFATWRWWQPVMDLMPGRYCAYAPDLRGCGLSEQPASGYTIAQHAEDMRHFMDALELNCVHLVGHSLGGCVALEVALAHPQRVNTLTLVAPAPAEGRSIVRQANGGLPLPSGDASVKRIFRWSEMLGMNRSILRQILAQMVPHPADGVDFDSLLEDAARMSNTAAAGHLESLKNWDVRDRLENLDLPVMIVGGQNDQLIPAELLRRTAEKLPRGRLVIWPQIGHAPQLQRPQRFLHLLQTFVESHSRPPLAEAKHKLFGWLAKWPQIQFGRKTADL